MQRRKSLVPIESDEVLLMTENVQLRKVSLGKISSSEDMLTTLSNIIALVKDYINADDYELYIHRDNKLIRASKPYDGGWGSVTKCMLPESAEVLSFPIESSNNDLLGVFVFCKSNMPFTEVQRKTAKVTCSWIGRSMLFKQELRVNGRNRALPNWIADLRQLIHGHINLENFISRSLDTLQKETSAEIINLYRTEAGSLFKMYGQVKEGLFLMSELDHDFKDNNFLNDIYTHHVGIKTVSEGNPSPREGQISEKSYLCLPIGEPSKTLLILELINSKSLKGFSDKDVEMTMDCGNACAAAFYFEYAHEENTTVCSLYKIQQHQIKKHIVSKKTVEAFFRSISQVTIPKNFFRFDFYPKNTLGVDVLSWVIFREVFRLRDIRDANSMSAAYVIIAAKQYYKDNPFHNLEHAFNMCHCMFLITRANQHFFTETETRALVVATLLHDIDHPGVGNQFIEFSTDPLARLYKFSYLEHHHVHIAKEVVQKSGIFSYLSGKDYKAAIELIQRAILHTNLATFLGKKAEIEKLIESETLDPNDAHHRDLIIGITMTTADLSGQCKPFDIAANLCERIIHEQQTEANKCLRQGLTFTGSIIGQTGCTANFQIHFNENIALPCFDIVRKIYVNVGAIYIGCVRVNDVWKKIASGEIHLANY